MLVCVCVCVFVCVCVCVFLDMEQREVKEGCPVRQLPVKHVSFPPGPAPPLVHDGARDDNVNNEH